MNDLNSVLIEGHLTRDIDLRYTASGLAVGKLNIAVNTYKKANDGYEQETSFFEVTAFGSTADYIKEKAVKGAKARIIGKLKQERWEKDGVKQSKVVIIANTVEIENAKKVETEHNASKSDGEPFEDDILF